MDKKKKPVKVPSEAEENQPNEFPTDTPTRVTQIVEVVEIEETENTPPETAKFQTETFQTPVKSESLEPVLEKGEDESESDAKSDTDNEAEEAVSAENSGDDEEVVDIGKSGQDREDREDRETAADTAENKPKQVVEELFSKPRTEGLMEISINRRKPGRSPMLWAIVVIVAAVVIGLGLITFSSHKSGLKSITSAKPSPTSAEIPTPTTATVALARTDITVQVLNGGGKAGAATKMKTLLTDKGYQVKDVGNTPEYSYNETQILVKSDKAAALDLLKTDLSDGYTIGTAAATLSADSQYDAQVTVGKE